MLVRLVGSSLGHASELGMGRRRRRRLRAVRDPPRSQETATAPKVPKSNIWSEAVGTLAAVFTFVGATGGAFTFVGATGGASDAEYGSALTSKLATGAADAITNEDDAGLLAEENAPVRSGQRETTAESTVSGEALFDRVCSGPLRETDVIGVDRAGLG
jgi:hypothetical protein